MNGLRVRIRNDRRVWTVVHDDGYWLIVVHWRTHERKQVRRSNITRRQEPGIGWVPTEMAA